MRECYSSRADAAAYDLAQSLGNDRNSKLDVLPGPMPGKSDKAELHNDAIRRAPQLQAHSLIDDPEVTLNERKRLA